MDPGKSVILLTAGFRTIGGNTMSNKNQKQNQTQEQKTQSEKKSGSDSSNCR